MTLKLHLFGNGGPIAGACRSVAVAHADAHSRPFMVYCHGEVEYPEDEPVHGVWRTPHTVVVGDAGRIAEAMELADAAVSRDDFDLDDLPEARGFWSERIVICDRADRLVLAGEVVGNAVRWSVPVSSDAEAERVAHEIDELRSEAAYEAGWDNYSTAKRLRERARILAGRLVHPAWREAASRALQLMTSS